MRRIVFLIALIFSLSAATMVRADAPAKEPVEELKTKQHISFHSDPLYTPSYEGATHPLGYLENLATNGDARAQFLMGDLCSKGKGGFKKDLKVAQDWFEKSARQKYPHSYVRLAALAKRQEKSIEAYQWYILGLKVAKKKDKRLYTYIKDQMVALKENAALEKDDIRKAEKDAKAWRKNAPRSAQSKKSSEFQFN